MPKLLRSSLRNLAASLPLAFLLACGSGTQVPTPASPAVEITTATLPSGTVGTPYTGIILAADGTPPYQFTISAGLIPAGLSMSSAGVLYGTPTTAGTYNFTASVGDTKGQRASQAYTVVIAASATNPPTITTTTLPSGMVGAGYSAIVVAANGATPYTFAVTGGALPAGLMLSTTGIITGTPTTAATSTFTITVTDAASHQASATYSVTITAASNTPVSLAASSLPTGTVGASYIATINAANGTTPYTYAITSGALPAGLSLSTSGAITGIPTASGTFPFTVTVTDAKATQASATFTLYVAPANSLPVSIVTTVLPSGTVNTAYATPIAAANGTAPYSFAVTAGALPAGLTLTAGGMVAGTPTTAGTYAFTVTVTDASSGHASQPYSVTIAAASTPVTVTTTSLPNGTVDVPYSATIVAANGTPSYTFLLGNSPVPPGLTLSPVGVLAGTPTTAGSYTFTFTVQDANNGQTTATPTVVIAAGAPLSLSPTAIPAGTVGTAYTANVVASGGAAPYNYALTAGTFPGGLMIGNNGAITGTPTQAGTFTFTLTAYDSSKPAQNISNSYTLTIAAAAGTLAIASTPLPAAIVNTAYTAPLQITGGTAPYSVAITNGTLPAGLSISTSGVISGTPTTDGAYTFTVKATDASTPTQSASATFTLTVVDATVAIDTTAAVTVVPQNFFGMHTSVYDAYLDDTAALPALLATGGITTLRYPGGSYADRYHWAQNSLTPVYASNPPACGIETGEIYLAPNTDFGSFMRTVEATGTQPVITINYGTSVANAQGSLTSGTTGLANHCSEPNTAGQPEEAAAWVAYSNGSTSSTQVIGADATGFNWQTVGFWASLRAASPLGTDDGYNFLRIAHPAPFGIHYWEIGNEMYYNGWSGNRNFEADLHAPYIYPNGYSGAYDSRDQLPALSPTAYGANAITFLQAMKAVDPTILVGVDFSSPGATDPIPLNWNPDLANAVCTGAQIDLAIIHYYPGTYNAVSAAELLSLPEYDIPRQVAGIKANLAQYCPANAAAIKFVLTETSPNGNLANNFPQAGVGLFALNDYMTALENGIQNIDWLELHNNTYLTDSETPGPAYYGIQLAHLLAAVGDTVVQATSSSGTVLSFATQKANGQTGILLVNANGTAAQTISITVTGATLGATATEYSYGVSTNQPTPALTGTPFSITGNTFTITIQPYTAVELNIP